jgi:hypothetical protein
MINYYLKNRNGGGVFFIPYFLTLFLIGIPVFTLELNIGQYTSRGAFSCWSLAPIFRGIGLSMNVASFYLAIFYNMIIAYAIYYLVLSFRATLLWKECSKPWATDRCVSDIAKYGRFNCSDQTSFVKVETGQCYNITDYYLNQIDGDVNPNATILGWWDLKLRNIENKPILPSDDFYK